MEQASIIGIDLAKHSFQIHCAAADGSVLLRKKLSRRKLPSFLSSQPPRFMQSIVSLPVAERSAQRVEVIDQDRSAGPLHKLLLPPGRESDDDRVGGQARVVHGGGDAETRGDAVAVAVRHKIRTVENEPARNLSYTLQQWRFVHVSPIAGTMRLVKLKVVPLPLRCRGVLDNLAHAAYGIGEPP